MRATMTTAEQLDPPWPGDESVEHSIYVRERARQILFGPDYLDILMDSLCDDLRGALDRDWPIFKDACARHDYDEIGLLVGDALGRAADQYLDTPAGRLLIEDVAAGLEAHE